jgi:GTP cyclohydrolase I
MSEASFLTKIPTSLANLETKINPQVTDAEMIAAVRTLLIGLGEDLDREGLKDIPKRVVKALKFLTSGYQQSLDELLNGAVFHEDASEMVLVRDIDPGFLTKSVIAKAESFIP